MKERGKVLISSKVQQVLQVQGIDTVLRLVLDRFWLDM